MVTLDEYRDRMRIPSDGHKTLALMTKSGAVIAHGYVRVVFGDRGPYVELLEGHLVDGAYSHIETAHTFYTEYRTIPDGVKLYHQIKRVDYADYRPGRYYVSPFELHTTAGPCIVPKPAKQLTLNLNADGEDEAADVFCPDCGGPGVLLGGFL